MIGAAPWSDRDGDSSMRIVPEAGAEQVEARGPRRLCEPSSE